MGEDQDRVRLDKLSDRIAEIAVQYSALNATIVILTAEVGKLRAASEFLAARGCPGFCQTEIDSIKEREQNNELRIAKLERYSHPPQNRGKRIVVDVGKIGGGLVSWELLRAMWRHLVQ